MVILSGNFIWELYLETFSGMNCCIAESLILRGCPAIISIYKNSDRCKHTRPSRARHGGAATLGGGRYVPQRGRGLSRTAVSPFHLNSYTLRKRASVRLFPTRSDPCRGLGRTKRGARWLKPSYVMSPCDFQKDSMFRHTLVVASKTIRVIYIYIYPWTYYFDYLGTDQLLDVNALAAR